MTIVNTNSEMLVQFRLSKIDFLCPKIYVLKAIRVWPI